jgi:hypothetical protein
MKDFIVRGDTGARKTWPSMYRWEPQLHKQFKKLIKNIKDQVLQIGHGSMEQTGVIEDESSGCEIWFGRSAFVVKENT